MAHNKLNIITFNVRSLIEHSRRIELGKVLEAACTDFGFIQETHLSKTHKCNIKGYRLIRNYDDQAVAVAVKQGYEYKVVTVQGVSFPNLLVAINIFIRGEARQLLIGSIYLPCNSPSGDIYEGLVKIANFASDYDFVIIGSDFNSKHCSWGDAINNSNGNVFYRWLTEFGTDFVRVCDRGPSFPGGSSYLDHFLLSSNLVDTTNINYDITTMASFSDHFPVCLRLNISNLSFNTIQPRYYLSYRDTDWALFGNDLTEKLLTSMPPKSRNLDNAEIDTLINCLTTEIKSTAESHARPVELKNEQYLDLPQPIRKLFAIKNNWQRQLKKIFHRNFNRVTDEYKILSNQLSLLKTIIKEQVEVFRVKNFGDRLKNITPGPHA